MKIAKVKKKLFEKNLLKTLSASFFIIFIFSQPISFAFKNGYINEYKIPLWTAIGEVGSGSGTLITLDRVLTAAHCVCVALQNGQMDCAKSARFRVTLLNNAYVELNGRVDVFPNYFKVSKDTSTGIDLAVIMLDENSKQIVRNAYQRGLILFMSLADQKNLPSIGKEFVIVGYGPNDVLCQGAIGRRNQVVLSLSLMTSTEMKFINMEQYACDGDSGGPVFNKQYKIVSVVTGVNPGVGLTVCTMTYPFQNWIMGPH
jgi:hypothetical protein